MRRSAILVLIALFLSQAVPALPFLLPARDATGMPQDILQAFQSAGADDTKHAPSRGHCREDSDCVPAQCCHATSCVVQRKAPDCTRTRCTRECVAGTLDCRQKSCACIRKRCTVR